MEVCSTEGWAKDRKKVLSFYDKRRAQLESAKPNSCHYYLSELEHRIGDKLINLTQNVDDLLERAGCKNVIHLHGKLRELRCEECHHEFDIGFRALNSEDKCPKCDSQNLRHNVVMFGESAPNYRHIYSSIEVAKLLIVIGTSGQVLDIPSMSKAVPRSVLVNPNREQKHGWFGAIDGFIDEDFTIFLETTATQSIERLEDIISECLRD
jgi:NAD-dependent deacetylase